MHMRGRVRLGSVRSSVMRWHHVGEQSIRLDASRMRDTVNLTAERQG